MAKKIHVHLIDDLDASEARETLRFELDGKSYEIDLSGSNAQKFRAEIGPYIGQARQVVRRWPPGRRSRNRSGQATRQGRGDPAEPRHTRRRAARENHRW